MVDDRDSNFFFWGGMVGACVRRDMSGYNLRPLPLPSQRQGLAGGVSS